MGHRQRSGFTRVAGLSLRQSEGAAAVVYNRGLLKLDKAGARIAMRWLALQYGIGYSIKL
jgi:hypothetical protein